ncbi:HNH endonuclease signature motif containing protein [Gimesia maris]|uniref:HNH endonuclease n=1 Tax=Gimesia maris TaxID=122 RepID=UPI0030D84942
MSALPLCYAFPLPLPQSEPVVPEIDDDDQPDVLPLEITQGQRRNYRRKLWERLPHCKFCGKKLKKLNDSTLDHLLPQAQGGGDQLWNLVLCCQQCNTLKANRTVEQWVSDILNGAEPVIHQH